MFLVLRFRQTPDFYSEIFVINVNGQYNSVFKNFENQRNYNVCLDVQMSQSYILVGFRKHLLL